MATSIAGALGRPSEVRLRYQDHFGWWQTVHWNAVTWSVNIHQEPIPLTQPGDMFQAFAPGERRIAMEFGGVTDVKPPQESLAVQMARAILEGDNAAAMALADAIVNNPEEAFACASS